MKTGALVVVLLAGLSVATYLFRSEHSVPEQHSSQAVLSIGLHPSAIDYSKYPNLDEATLTARIEAGESALRAAGFDIVSCQLSADPDAAEAQLRECVGDGKFRAAMIGAGVRMAPEHTVLFERLINVTGDLVPGIRFCFNTSPENTIDALRRWVQPG